MDPADFWEMVFSFSLSLVAGDSSLDDALGFAFATEGVTSLHDEAAIPQDVMATMVAASTVTEDVVSSLVGVAGRLAIIHGDDSRQRQLWPSSWPFPCHHSLHHRHHCLELRRAHHGTTPELQRWDEGGTPWYTANP